MSFPAQLHSSRHSTGAGQASYGRWGHGQGLQMLCAKDVRPGAPSPWGSPGHLFPWHLLGSLADVVQAEGGQVVLGTHKQASALLIH